MASMIKVLRGISLKRLHQGSSLSLRSKIPLNVLVQPDWRDDGVLSMKQVKVVESKVKLSVSEQDDQKTSMGRLASHTSIEIEDAGDEAGIHWESIPDQDSSLTAPGTYLDISVPEKLNLTCILEKGGSISIKNKIEGDVELSTTDGNLHVKKLRGHNVTLSNHGASNIIYSSDLLEADKLSITTRGRLRAKQLHGNSIDVSVDWNNGTQDESLIDEDDDGSVVDISSLYVSGHGGATITVNDCAPPRRAVRVKSHHGPVQVKTRNVAVPTEENKHTGTTFPVVELGGVNGSCEVEVDDTKGKVPTSWKSCMIHLDSLSQDTVSLARVDKGDIGITVDRKVESDLRLLSMPENLTAEIADELAEEEEIESFTKKMGFSRTSGQTASISIQTNVFTSKAVFTGDHHAELVDGWVENKSSEPDSRFEQKVRGDVSSSVGKIRIEDAATQALHGFQERSEDGSASFQRPLFAVAGPQSIFLETVSWLGAIARRYGLEEGGRELGRTAARRGRGFTPNE